jgi:hypothetical protein
MVLLAVFVAAAVIDLEKLVVGRPMLVDLIQCFVAASNPSVQPWCSVAHGAPRQQQHAVFHSVEPIKNRTLRIRHVPYKFKINVLCTNIPSSSARRSACTDA